MKKTSDQHDENIKRSIDTILGTNTVIKKGKRSADDIKRDLFCEIIELIMAVEERSIIMAEMYHTDLSTHNNIFFAIIEKFFLFSFNPDQHRIIQFYIYERYRPDGSIIDLLDKHKNSVPLNTHGDLWYFLKTIK